jgi:hypothetical protein
MRLLCRGVNTYLPLIISCAASFHSYHMLWFVGKSMRNKISNENWGIYFIFIYVWLFQNCHYFGFQFFHCQWFRTNELIYWTIMTFWFRTNYWQLSSVLHNCCGSSVFWTDSSNAWFFSWFEAYFPYLGKIKFL